MGNPKVSIIVPIYNVEKYLDRCMNSLINQTLKDIEIIMVDDGSPDNCPKMCDEWAKKDSRIKVVHKKNGGLGYARNSGLDVATGEYVAFVDSDDYIDLKMYEILYDNATKSNADAVFCGFKKEVHKRKFVDVRECESYKEFRGADVQQLIPDFIAAPPYSSKEYVYEMSVWHSIYRNSVIKDNNIKFVSERDYSSEDLPFQLDFLKKANIILFIPDILYNYCWNESSLTKRINEEKFYKIVALYNLLCKKSKLYDEKGLRAKRLFIGYIRAYVRTLTKMEMSYKEKMHIINNILKHNVWDEIASNYKIEFLPLEQKPLSMCLLRKNAYGTYWCAKMMELLNKIKHD